MQESDSAIDLVKQFLANFEKRQRNLGKRKSKLDSYREKLARGEVLNDEQKKAVEGYEGVLNSIILMQEMATQSKELLNAIERTSELERSKMERILEERTLSFLQICSCLQRFLSMLDSPSVRDAIVKSTSEGNLKLLDCVRGLVTAQLVDDLPSVLTEVPSHLQSREDLKSVSQNLYNFVNGRSVPIPLSVTGEGSKKHTSFRDARNLCFRLMANPTIQRSMGVISTSDNVPFSPDGDQAQNSPNGMSEPTMDRVSEPGDRFANENPKVAHDATRGFPGQHSSFPEVSAEPIIDHIKSVGSTFNFLQIDGETSDCGPHDSKPDFVHSISKSDASYDSDASRVEVPVQLPEESASYGENSVVLNPESSGVVEFLSGPTEVDELNPGSHSIDKLTISETMNSEHAENDTHSNVFMTEEPIELAEHSSQLDLKHNPIEEVELTPAASKPISYADSVRKISFTGPGPQRGLGETQSNNRRVDKPKENREDRGDLPHQNMRGGYSRGGPYRGRSSNFDGRGDRGGAPRRGVGPRAQNHYGRGGAPRGMPQEIAQTTY